MYISQLRSNSRPCLLPDIAGAPSVTNMLTRSKSNLFSSKNEAILVNKILPVICPSKGISPSRSSKKHSPSKNQTEAQLCKIAVVRRFIHGQRHHLNLSHCPKASRKYPMQGPRISSYLTCQILEFA